jgi:hypothetical protein
MTVATAFDESWNPLLTSNASTMTRQTPSMAMTIVDAGAK